MGGTINEEKLLVLSSRGLAERILAHVECICLAAGNHQKRLIDKLHIVGCIKSEQIHIAAYSVGIVFADRFISELGNQLCELHPEIDFVAIIDIANQKVSYRTIRDDINLGVFAQHYGGGGHPKAAGSQFTEDVLRNTVGKIFNH